MKDSENSVLMWEEDIEIPTYPAGEAEKNPMFLEKRVYQGSSGRVYPLPVIEKISDEKVMRKYRTVFLENKYIQVWIMPELGGRIQRAVDKTNGYDFIYYNRVIKPALVGLAGPWISGGIEFNWPQHHRPSTFMPIEYMLKENDDGSKTVFVGEIDRMYGTKCTAGFTLYPDKAYIEIKVQLYNRTCVPQTFLWWANPAFSVNDKTQSIFSPDVHAVFDHGKRDVSTFPIATGTYYKVDYSRGVDISVHKNIPVPTSYMAYKSDYDFVGAYDYGREAGLLHVADHHISPGKKQWTWGNGDFGRAWERNLTDEDGPYIELMTGVFTDNQPDFSWLNPYEEKTFTQYFMPYKKIGAVKNATVDAAVNLDVVDNSAKSTAKISVYATSVFDDAVIELCGKGESLHKETVRISPVDVYTKEIALPQNINEYDLALTVKSKDGRVLVSYTPKKTGDEKTPEPAKAIPAPSEVENNEALYLAGLHLEQYRHATYEPEDYYKEGLKRDPGDIRINNAYGLLLYKRGQFEKSEEYFRRAIKTLTRHNPNPYDGEPYYNLGLALKMQGKIDEAYNAFYKSCWNAAMQCCGYYALATIAAMKGNFRLALEHAENSIIRNYHNYKARNLKSALYRKLGEYDKALICAAETLSFDILDFGARNELYLTYKALSRTQQADDTLSELLKIMRGCENNYIELSLDYADAGMYDEAICVLQRLIDEQNKKSACISPMVYYYLGWYYEKSGDSSCAQEYYKKGALAKPDFCFPNKLSDIIILESAIRANPNDAKAYYYLGNLWYDKKQYSEAIKCWEKTKDIDDTFPTVHRNLSLAYYNKLKDAKRAVLALERAFELDPNDSRVFFELDQLYKKTGASIHERLSRLEEYKHLVESRDDLYIEYITLLNLTGDYEKAHSLIMKRNFHPWEGGEGKVTKQYVLSLMEIGKKHLRDKNYTSALDVLMKAAVYPTNLGEGKLSGAQENDLNYYIGCAYEGLGDSEKAKEYFEKASTGIEEPSGVMFYNDVPPEMIFYQGLACIKLGNPQQAKEKFGKLINYGEKHLHDIVTIDYFAVSLPDFLIFDDDLNKRNEVLCRYLLALGHMGLGNLSRVKEEFEQALTLDPSHIGVIIHSKMIKDDTFNPYA